MKLIKTAIDEIVIIEPAVFADDRGSFLETYQLNRYKEAGITTDFVQDNLSYSSKGTIRGLHYQLPNSQAKLVQVISGEVYDVAVDIRRGSPTFGQYISTILSEMNKRQLYIPDGFAHGFCVISDTAIFAYKCSNFYSSESEKGLIWSDTEIAIDWPQKNPLLSNKDSQYPCLKDVPPENLPVFRGKK